MVKCLFTTSALAIVLSVIHMGLLLHGARQNFVTNDEPGHVAAGISHWETGDYTMFRVNPPLVRKLAVLPVLLTLPDTTGIEPDHKPGNRAEWAAGQSFLAANRSRFLELFFLARLPGILWSLLGTWVVFSWARELYGPWAGCLGVAIWCLGPNILGNAQLISEDVPAAVAGSLATYWFWRYLRNATWTHASGAGLLLGVALCTKFTLLILCLVWPLLWLISGVRLNTAGFITGWASWAYGVLHGIWMVVLSIVIVNCVYEFQGTCRQLGEYTFISRAFAGEPTRVTGAGDQEWAGNRFRGHWLGRCPVPLPEDFLLGIDQQRWEFEQSWRWRPSYLAGEWRQYGWWYYYLYALAVKVPLGIWALVLWAIALTLVKLRHLSNWRDEVVLWLPAAVILAVVSSQTGFNRHMRYVLPALPFVVIGTSKVSTLVYCGRRLVILPLCICLAYSIGSTLRVHPHELSYFNEAAGGPENGYHHLENSNIDWGQDLLFLKEWLDEHSEARPLGLAYYNTADPELIGIEYTLPPFGHKVAGHTDRSRCGPVPGYFAISVNLLVGAVWSAPNGHGGHQAVPLGAFDYFRYFEPIARAGFSIYIYHITIEDANNVRQRLDMPSIQ
jgi:Dolichyl-phosphate-mannose-protein mannosyltransferase